MSRCSTHWCFAVILGLSGPIGQAQDNGHLQVDAARILICVDSCREAEEAGDYPRALRILERAMEVAKAEQDTARIALVAVKRGVINQRMGDYNAALSDFYQALRSYTSIGDLDGIAEVNNNIGSIHHYDRNYTKAASFYAQSLAIREAQGNPEQRALLLNNFGSLYEDRNMPDSALHFLRRALAFRLAQGDSAWVAVTYANMGSCFDKSGATDSARIYLRRGLSMIPRSQNEYLQGSMNIRLGSTYLGSGKSQEAIRLCRIGLDAAERLKLLPMVQRGCECLFKAYKESGNAGEALRMYERFIAARDSMFGQDRAKELTRIELTHNFEQRQLADSLASAEQRRTADLAFQQGIRGERDQKRVFLLGSILVLILAAGLWSRLRHTRRSRNVISKERERSDKLLLSILPRRVADELKEHGKAQAREVDEVSILFTDFQGFASLTEQMSAQELVESLDACFKAFDAISLRYGAEKIKTIGDAYMCAGGLPEWRPQSARDTVFAALDMLDWLVRHNALRTKLGKPTFAMRAGVHSGPVVAGIVGDSKFQYDVWGDTVNIAARMESSGEVGRLNISASTYLMVKETDGLQFTPRGKVTTKGKGELEMYFVERVPIHV
ncbi:MAG: tetratricopeptide repeat protein [Flavobacteriales bacterium]|nr:tetratricopeptide repeat protein [Flavobacteriales bacterium]MCC6937867.1 tetratricopeptide repeat protein [Flavobacteriales bacterium]